MISLVYMNHGRWVVDCPTEGCGWAYLATTGDGKPRYLHRCQGCQHTIELAWPPLDAALEIERILCERAAPVNRNWRHPETIDGLSRENQTMLVGWTLQRLAEEIS